MINLHGLDFYSSRTKQIKRQWRVCYFENITLKIYNISKIAVSAHYYLYWIIKSNFIKKMSSFKRISALSVRRTYSPVCWICLLCIKCEGCRFFIAKCISYVVLVWGGERGTYFIVYTFEKYHKIYCLINCFVCCFLSFGGN